MDSSSFYTQHQDDASLLRNGGIILKGRTRNSRQPVHLMLLVDTSGSMEMEQKLSSVKRSIHLLLELLSPDDRLSLITFADDSKIFLNRVMPTPEERQAIQYRVNNLEPDGSTNMSAGLLEVRNVVEPAPPTRPDLSQPLQAGDLTRKQGLLLLTDGHANIGVHTEEGLLEILKRLQTESSGLSLTTVAYGVDHNAEMLTNLAKVGGGAYNVVSNLEDVATVFGDILGGLVSVSAQKVQLQFPPGAELTTSYRTEKDASGMTTVYVGDIYADAEITVLFRSSPSCGGIRIKGTDMTTLDPIDVVVEPTLLTEVTSVPVVLVMAEYKQKVVQLLSSLRNGNPSSVLPEIESLSKQIQDDDRIQSHPLKAILVEDLEQAKTLSRRGGRLTQNETVEMAQHSAYLGMSRGLRTTTSQISPDLRNRRRGNQMVSESASGPITPPRAAGAMTSPFANNIQAQMATAMRTMSSRPAEEDSQ